MPVFGVSDPGDAAVVRALFAAWDRAGVPRQQQAQMVKRWNDKWAHKRLDPSSDDDWRAVARDFSETFGMDVWEKTAPIIDTVFESGIDAIPASPDPNAAIDETRRAELERLMRSDFDAYSKDPFLQQEMLDLQTRLEERDAPEMRSAEPSGINGLDRAARIAEIEKTMRTEPGRYWGQDRSMRHEYAQIVESEMATLGTPAGQEGVATADAGGGE